MKLIHTLLSVPLWKYLLMAPEIRESSRLSEALQSINSRWGDVSDAQDNQAAPVFIFSAGWGSGSTLVQRLVMTSGEMVIWGEPYDQAIIIPRLGAALGCIRDEWPPDSQFISTINLEELTQSWIANLVPPVSALRSAHQAFVQTWLGEPATHLGVSRWGFKEVRLTIDHARYLKWLFPEARFLFVYRNLFNCYKSCKKVNWYSAWPKYKVKNPIGFAHHWRHLLEGFLNGYKDVDGMMIRYEDLISGKLDPDLIAKHIRVEKINPEVLERKIGNRGHRQKGISIYEKIVLKGVAGDIMQELGYSQD